MGTDYHIWVNHTLNFDRVDYGIEEFSKRRGMPYIGYSYNNEKYGPIPPSYTGIAVEGPDKDESWDEKFQNDPGLFIDVYENGEEIESYWFIKQRVLVKETDHHPLWLGSRWSGFHADITDRYFAGMEEAFNDLPKLTAFLGSTEVLVSSDNRNEPCFDFEYGTIEVGIPEILGILLQDPSITRTPLEEKGEVFIPEDESYYNMLYRRILGKPVS